MVTYGIIASDPRERDDCGRVIDYQTFGNFNQTPSENLFWLIMHCEFDMQRIRENFLLTYYIDDAGRIGSNEAIAYIRWPWETDKLKINDLIMLPKSVLYEIINWLLIEFEDDKVCNDLPEVSWRSEGF